MREIYATRTLKLGQRRLARFYGHCHSCDVPGLPWLAEVGRTSKAIAPAEEAVAIFEAEAQRSPEEVASSRWDPPWHAG